MGDVAMSREVAEVQGAMIIAKKFPRNQMKALDRILVACQRPLLAESALYSYARGGTEVTGPSIRLAEAIAQNWGNISFGIRELEQRLGESTVESFALDLETNTRQTKTFQVKHIRHTRAKGNYALEDPRDIYEMVANQGARRLRACILGVIPGDVVEAAVNQCEGTLKAKADISPEAIQKMVGVFKESGVTREMIEKRIQRKLDSITPAQVISLRKIYNSLKDGMSTPADWFDFEPEEMNGATQAERIKNKLRGKKKDSEAPDTDPAKATEGPSAEKGGVGGGTLGPRGITAEQSEVIRGGITQGRLNEQEILQNFDVSSLEELHQEAANQIIDGMNS
ncbi:MAG: hypothetical protein WC749_01955 [Dehalococcoidia bacterium]